MKKRNIVLNGFIIIFFILCFSQCDKNKQKPFNLKKNNILSLITELKSHNVKASPFTNVDNYFPLIKENLSEKLETIHELSSIQQKVWTAITNRTVLYDYESNKPYGMKLLFNDKPIPYLDEPDDNQIKWQLIKITREIDIQKNKHYNKHFQCIIMDEGESFSFETILPSTTVMFEISARRNGHPLELEIYLDESLVAQKALTKEYEKIQVKINTTCSMHKISIKSKVKNRLKTKLVPTPPRLLVQDIYIQSKKDVILFLVPTELQKKFKTGRLHTQYLTNQNEFENKNVFLPLYKMKYDFTLDKSEQKNNPENIKKKIMIEDLSLDVLMAPPLSQFEFKLKVHPKSILEFGIGIFHYNDKKIDQKYATRFKIIAEYNTTKKLIFNKTLPISPGLQREQLNFEKIELTEFANKKINLIFLTEKAQEDPLEENVFSFWFNPIIYQPALNSPKVILISLDTLRADHLSCYGYTRETSPNIDSIIEDSIMFENVYAQSPWTLPSHTSMLFSLNSARHNIYYNDQKIDSSLPSLAYFLQNYGFITYAFTGGGYVSNLFGFAKGFHYYSEPGRGGHEPLSANEAEKLFHYSSEWIKENKDKPFFLFLHTFQIHGPYECPSPWNSLFLDKDAKWKNIALLEYLEANGNNHVFTPEERNNIIALYDGEIRYTDEILIKPLISLLKKLNIYDDTLLVITSDHGEEFYEHNGWLHGRTLYEEQIKVPLIIKFPQSIYRGKIKEKCRLIDIMPTILDVLSVKYKKSVLDGKSLIDLITRKEQKDRTFISDLAHKNVPIPCPALIATNKDHMKLIVEKSSSRIKNV